MVNVDVVFIPTPKLIVRQMLQAAQLRRGEVLFDLGAGDGRIIIEAARRFGARAIGIEIDPERVARIRDRLKSTGVSAEVIQANFLDADLSSADVVAIYLSDSANSKIEPKLRRELKPTARIVSLDYTLPGWVAAKERSVTSGGVTRTFYLYRMPQEKIS